MSVKPRKVSPAEKSVLSRLAAVLGTRGAEVTNARMTPEQRKAWAKKAAAERWRRYKQTKGEGDEIW
jgi:hypothetical protein